MGGAEQAPPETPVHLQPLVPTNGEYKTQGTGPERLVEGDCSPGVSPDRTTTVCIQNGAFTGNLYIIFTHVHSEPASLDAVTALIAKQGTGCGGGDTWSGLSACASQPPRVARLHAQKAAAMQPLPAALSVTGGVSGLWLSLITGLDESPGRLSEVRLIPSRVVHVLEHLPHQLLQVFAGSLLLLQRLLHLLVVLREKQTAGD